jgi:hypothetical protein
MRHDQRRDVVAPIPDRRDLSSFLRNLPAPEAEDGIAFLERAVRLDPRDLLARKALATVREGAVVNVRALNRAILGEAEHIG